MILKQTKPKQNNINNGNRIEFLGEIETEPYHLLKVWFFEIYNRKITLSFGSFYSIWFLDFCPA